MCDVCVDISITASRWSCTPHSDHSAQSMAPLMRCKVLTKVLSSRERGGAVLDTEAYLHALRNATLGFCDASETLIFRMNAVLCISTFGRGYSRGSSSHSSKLAFAHSRIYHCPDGRSRNAVGSRDGDFQCRHNRGGDQSKCPAGILTSGEARRGRLPRTTGQGEGRGRGCPEEAGKLATTSEPIAVLILLGNADILQAAAREAFDKLKAGKDSPDAVQRRELVAKLKSIREQQGTFKKGRDEVNAQIKADDSKLRAKIDDIKRRKESFAPHKSVEDVSAEIERLNKQVESATLRAVEEKKILEQVGALQIRRKQFSTLADEQAKVDALKESIAAKKKGLVNPEFQALSTQYDETAKKLDALKEKESSRNTDMDAARKNMNDAHSLQQEKYKSLKALEDDYYKSKRAYGEYQRELSRQLAVKRQADRDEYNQKKKAELLQEKLEEASLPAYSAEIKACNALLTLISGTSEKAATTSGPGQYAASAQRTVDASAFQGAKVLKRDDDEDFMKGIASKKNKKGRRSAPFNAGVYVTQENSSLFDLIKEPIPDSPEAVATAKANIEIKRQVWIEDAPRKTKENIAAAQKEIDELSAGAGRSRPYSQGRKIK
ncbi:hypothetical protein MRB53_038491 [Persea americana]|nr:hypothetical protein MRB53_038491 [Persea americana]